MPQEHLGLAVLPLQSTPTSPGQQMLITHGAQVRRPGRQRWQLCSSTWLSWGGCWRTLQGCSSAPVCCCQPPTWRRSSTCSATAMLNTRQKGLRRRAQVLGPLPGRTQTLRMPMKSSASQVRSDPAGSVSGHSCHCEGTPCSFTQLVCFGRQPVTCGSSSCLQCVSLYDPAQGYGYLLHQCNSARSQNECP